MTRDDRSDRTGRDGMVRCGVVWDAMEWDGVGRGGMRWSGVGWGGTGWGSMRYEVASCVPKGCDLTGWNGVCDETTWHAMGCDTEELDGSSRHVMKWDGTWQQKDK